MIRGVINSMKRQIKIPQWSRILSERLIVDQEILGIPGHKKPTHISVKIVCDHMFNINA
jgi:hypothetical protein